MELCWTTETVGGVTLVRVRLWNKRAVKRRVRLRNQLDGPVLPPRRQREPEAGWDREGLTAVVPPGSAVACGYACPAPSEEPPVELTAVGSPDEMASCGPREEMAATAEPVNSVIRELGDARPPRAVLGEEPPSGGGESRESGPSRQERGEAESALEPHSRSRTGTERADSPAERDRSPDFGQRLVPYRRRIETVEVLNLASVTEATAILDTNGSVPGVERLGEQLDDDAATLRALAVEAATLAARAEAATPPLDALRRLS